MAAGGVQVMPQPARDTGLLPNRMVALWPYSKMNDPRINWGDRYIVLRQIPGMKAPFKLGIPNEGGWAAYFNHGNLFIKHFSHIAGGRYPDYGSSYETYTNHIMMEMESLSPLKLVEPEGTYLIWLDFKELHLDNDALEHLIVRKAGLWLDGGMMFGPGGAGFQRINIACPRSILSKAMEQLERAINTL
jgi:hypothetical protein